MILDGLNIYVEKVEGEVYRVVWGNEEICGSAVVGRARVEVLVDVLNGFTRED